MHEECLNRIEALAVRIGQLNSEISKLQSQIVDLEAEATSDRNLIKSQKQHIENLDSLLKQAEALP